MSGKKFMNVSVRIQFSEPVVNTGEVIQNIEFALGKQIKEYGLSPQDEEAFVEGIEICEAPEISEAK